MACMCAHTHAQAHKHMHTWTYMVKNTIATGGKAEYMDTEVGS